MALVLTTLFGYMDKISVGLEKNVLVTDTLDGMLHTLDRTEMSQEILDKLLVEYVQYLVFSLLGMVIERASDFPMMEKEELALDADIALLTEQKNKYVENTNLLEVRRTKEQAKIGADIALLTEQKNKYVQNRNLLEAKRAKANDRLTKELALLFVQEQGFAWNDKYNVLVNNTEMIALFAQNGVNPEQWMKDVIRLVADDLG